ncbi:Adenylosuccinate synthase [Microsporum canis]|uniref:Adenylosuccinate synthetase n=1 Tax=Arthroderma otae (strain ATCC MYA-4605 / CBS 113480) TaxID=554155 RepID=PURA_ARTOC|nr:adenylosuccinate synthetase [Microsporum canis CBS 113480]C5FC83.1 RecName: Full=Adenylosuccinate synthetase; Short=AMPSase; Short=AdSS; AltName: Full=IMP--aspartate ligase [Microsporum canis CBS 113480]EEQ27506.1 adenylosuccinate synthetase [Microsporum canis CBS 113480]
MVTIVLGSQWGDEGKGKITDLLSQKAELCCRSAGGHNAGHTIVHDDITYDFHILPSGLVSPTCVNLIGAGTVVHVPSFFKELASLDGKGLKDVRDRVFISDRAQVCFDLHAVVDGLEEAGLGTRKVGTTGKGIGPCYSDKAARRGVRIGDIMDEGVLESKLRSLEAGYRRRFGELDYNVEEEIARFKEYRSLLKPHIVDQLTLVKKFEDESASILVEGANALMLDIDYGTYPFVTSSCTGLGGAVQGVCLNPTSIKSIVGVVKAYCTRVGSGPFPTEQLNEVGEKLQVAGREFGVTTGRKRRCGWLDMVLLRYSARINHYTALNLTKLDILDDFDEIKVAVAYKLDGKELESFPASSDALEKVEIVYETLPGWKSTTMGVSKWEDLPVNAQKYVEYIEHSLGGVPIKWIGTGPARSHMIDRN